jgi:hypothetical protein
LGRVLGLRIKAFQTNLPLSNLPRDENGLLKKPVIGTLNMPIQSKGEKTEQIHHWAQWSPCSSVDFWQNLMGINQKFDEPTQE